MKNKMFEVKKKFKKTIRKIYINILLNYIIQCRKIRIKKISSKKISSKKINIAFVIIHHQVWKLEKLFDLLLLDNRFNLNIFICPSINEPEERIHQLMRESYVFFSEKYKNVEVINTYNSGEWLDIKEYFKPDIIFFTNPHRLTKEQYYIKNFHDVLSIYVPYSFPVTSSYDMEYNLLFHNLLWKFYVPTQFHQQICGKIACNRGENVIVSGYPGTEYLYDKNYRPLNIWKNDNRKKIIWAPHHTIEDDFYLNVANFLEYASLFKELAIRYKDSIQIAFKPHPLLKNKLYKHKDWGRKATDQYYFFWCSNENTFLENDDYIDLFLTSDAMIHDSISFLAEYAFTKKPVCYLINKSTKNSLNKLGENILETTYMAKNEIDIITFIDKVVIDGNDEMFYLRDDLFNEKLMVNDSVSKYIYDDICRSIFK